MQFIFFFLLFVIMKIVCSTFWLHCTLFFFSGFSFSKQHTTQLYGLCPESRHVISLDKQHGMLKERYQKSFSVDQRIVQTYYNFHVVCLCPIKAHLAPSAVVIIKSVYTLGQQIARVLNGAVDIQSIFCRPGSHTLQWQKADHLLHLIDFLFQRDSVEYKDFMDLCWKHG